MEDPTSLLRRYQVLPSTPASVPVPIDPCSLEDYDDVKFAGQHDPTNVLSVTGQVNRSLQKIDVVCSEELVHHMSCVRSGIVLLKQESRLVLQER